MTRPDGWNRTSNPSTCENAATRRANRIATHPEVTRGIELRGVMHVRMSRLSVTCQEASGRQIVIPPPPPPTSNAQAGGAILAPPCVAGVWQAAAPVALTDQFVPQRNGHFGGKTRKRPSGDQTSSRASLRDKKARICGSFESRRGDSNPGPHHYECYSLFVGNGSVEPNREAIEAVCDACVAGRSTRLNRPGISCWTLLVTTPGTYHSLVSCRDTDIVERRSTRPPAYPAAASSS